MIKLNEKAFDAARRAYHKTYVEPYGPLRAAISAYLSALGSEPVAWRPHAIGDPVTKTSGYPFPGEIRAAFTNRSGDLRYVVEATGAEYAGMLHIFSPSQLAAQRSGHE